jgi:hypothetical protein
MTAMLNFIISMRNFFHLNFITTSSDIKHHKEQIYNYLPKKKKNYFKILINFIINCFKNFYNKFKKTNFKKNDDINIKNNNIIFNNNINNNNLNNFELNFINDQNIEKNIENNFNKNENYIESHTQNLKFFDEERVKNLPIALISIRNATVHYFIGVRCFFFSIPFVVW